MSKDQTATIDAERTPEELAVAQAAADKYDASNVDVLRDFEHIRQRPGMYIGDTGTKGLHHLVYELVANSVDEALAGFCKHINVRINLDGSLSVADDGRGIPVDEHPKEKRPTLEVVMTTVGAGAKFGKGTYKVSAGLHGMGAKAVTALSEWTEAQVQRSGRTYMQEYERGKAVTPVRDIGASKRTGTLVKFKPDPEIFHEVTFDYDTLEDRLRELAFLNKGLTLSLHDERTGKEETFKADGGVSEFVKYINRMEEPIHPPIHIEKTVDQVAVEISMQYTRGEEERNRCYTNNAFNSIGGTHLSGFRTALTRTLNGYGAKEELFKNVSPIGDDFREGLTVVISVQVPEPQFDSQEKKRLNNLEVEGIVAGVVSEHLGKFLEENPKVAQTIIKKVALAAEAREAASKAKKALKDRKSILSGGGLPGKLFDCTSRDRDEGELFLVEGDSAGGSAESGRDRTYQAILPLRGKPLNVEKARLENLLNNAEITSLISAIGVDIGNTEDVAKLRYGKIIILTDADVDGQHIRTLLLTFFYRQMAKLVEDGRIFVARPPLYRVKQKKDVRFVATAEEMGAELMERGLKETRLTVLPSPGDSAEPRVIQGEELAALVKAMTRLDDALLIVERLGLNLAERLPKVDGRGLPMYRVTFRHKDEWFHTLEEQGEYLKRKAQELGHDLVVGDDSQTNGNGEDRYYPKELHKVREVNRGLEELRRFGLAPTDLLPPLRLAGREPAPRLVLDAGDQRRQLNHLRDLVGEVRRLGERGMEVTRFKGLGEMNPEELWETTLDPNTRTLMRVQLDDALKADELFRTLMGEKVEPRKEFIQKYALEVKEIDYHGA
ncbi:MAG TPA: DNA gyrase subunit B [Gemmataceae bacterium]|nr:DNA gyrase subunit B [Gemmataceae bacterium]